MSKKEDISKIRHSLSHLLASAVKELYPNAKPAIGPPTETGFYYDFDFGEITVGEENLKEIEKKMKEILDSWEIFEKQEVSKKEALEYFKDNPYKTELIEEIVNKNEKITFYKSGDFTDLCEGGHVENAKNIPKDAFTLTTVAGAYWRGDENKKMLTRIYGLAFESKKELKEYIEFLEEAKKRDHRKIGKELDLFTFSDLVGPGLPLWTSKGTAMRNAIVNKIQSIQSRYGFEAVTIPHITKIALYEKSGHAEKFSDELLKVKSKDSEEFALKPMNCPHHTQIYNSSLKSYRDLPVRLSETTMVYRDEQKGELLGISRTRSITQDDGHIFCTPQQVEGEIGNIVKVIEEFYTSLDLYKKGNFRVSLSTRDPENPKQYIGTDSQWNEAEEILEKIAQKKEMPYKREDGEAAFYGPKIDFMFKDAIGREWQLATIQLDFGMPKRFGLEYVDKDGEKKTPVMIHRAVAGSLERFLSVIIEHFAGAFPFWLSPVQLKVIPIGETQKKYAEEIHKKLKDHGFRSEMDVSNDNFSKKIRNVKKEKIPYFLVIGEKEESNKTVTLEGREGKEGERKIEDLIKYFDQLK